MPFIIPFMIVAIVLNACSSVKLPPVPIGQSKHSVTRLLSPTDEAGGTGFEINLKGRSYTLTNAHVCRLGKKEGYLLAVPSYGEVQRINILLQSEVTDLCLLEPVDTLRPLDLASNSYIKERLHVVGHPLLGPLTRTDGIRGKEDTITVMDFPIFSDEDEKACMGPKYKIQDGLFGKICTSRIHAQYAHVLIKPGSSGSPVLDQNEHVIGVAFAGDRGTLNAWIIPLQDIRTFLEKFDARQPA